MAKLAKKILKIPSSAGVYLFKDKKGQVLYVGKSANLRARVRSYFAAGVAYHPLKSRLLEAIADVEVRPTENEIGALVLEAQLIKKLKPRFNVSLRDNKNYIWVGFIGEDFPRIVLTHQTTNYPLLTTHYIGPFTDARALRRTLGLLRKIFPYYSKRKHLAIERQMGLVPPETVSIGEYKENIRAIKNILTGRKKTLVRQIRKQIKAAAKTENYERAAALKERLEYIQSVLDHALVLGAPIAAPPIFADERPNFRLLGLTKEPERIEAYDISNLPGRQAGIRGNEAVGSMIVFGRSFEGLYEPAKNEYRKFKIKTVRGANDPAMIAEVVARRVKHKEWPLPDLVVIDGGRAQLNAALSVLTEPSVRIIALAKRLEEVYLPERPTPVPASRFGETTKRLLQALRDETHRFGVQYHRRLHRKAMVD